MRFIRVFNRTPFSHTPWEDPGIELISSTTMSSPSALADTSAWNFAQFISSIRIVHCDSRPIRIWHTRRGGAWRREKSSEVRGVHHVGSVRRARSALPGSVRYNVVPEQHSSAVNT